MEGLNPEIRKASKEGALRAEDLHGALERHEKEFLNSWEIPPHKYFIMEEERGEKTI
jgi:hypothetical protein